MAEVFVGSKELTVTVLNNKALCVTGVKNTKKTKVFITISQIKV